jgi:GT2 family glycosyltransferase
VVRADLFRRLGGFDERIDMYMEDDDLCYRARKAGFRTGIATEIAVVHLKGQSIQSNRRRKRLYYKSQVYYWRKHHGLVASLVMRLFRLPWRFVQGW